MKKIIFIDRDGTLIVEPQNEQINSLKEMTFMPNVISSLKRLYEAGFVLIIVTNQDALGSTKNPRDNYELINAKMLEIFESEGVKFYKIFECVHEVQDNCNCRKPKIGMIDEFLKQEVIDKSKSFMIGDRKTDMHFAKNIDIKGFELCKSQNWEQITSQILQLTYPKRAHKISRKTSETDITLDLCLDGEGRYNIDTGLKFFDHMLEQLSKHSNFDIALVCKGDLEVDGHHSVEDVAIVLGEAFRKALGDKRGFERFAWERILVMDEAKSEVSLDLSGRSFLVFDASFGREYVGDLPTEMIEHFFHSFCVSAKINMHIKITGKNAHHKIESCFKAFARCLKSAICITSDNISSTKGML